MKQRGKNSNWSTAGAASKQQHEQQAAA